MSSRMRISVNELHQVRLGERLRYIHVQDVAADGFFAGEEDGEPLVAHAARSRIGLACGDSLERLRKLPDKHVRLTLTSPPYFQQRAYTGSALEIGREETINGYIDTLLKYFEECLRVTRDDGSIVWNMGDKYIHGGLLLVPYRFAIEVMTRFPDVRLVNNVTWIKPDPCPRQTRRRLVPATEPFFHFAKTKDYYFNLDAVRDERPRKTRQSGPNIGHKYFALIEESGLTEEQKDAARQELQKAMDETRAGRIPDFRMKIKGIHKPPYGGGGGGRNAQLERDGYTVIRNRGGQMHKDVIQCAVGRGGHGIKHPAIFPLALPEFFIRLLTRVDDIVLDPFLGAGTTALACKRLGRRCVGFDLSDEFRQEAWRRLKNDDPSPKTKFPRQSSQESLLDGLEVTDQGEM